MATETSRPGIVARAAGTPTSTPDPVSSTTVRLSVAAAFTPAVLAVAAALVYGRVGGYVYSEFSDVALNFGSHPWYQSLSLGDVIGKYFSMSQGWYRPTSTYLVPYALRLDYFAPASIVAANIAFFVITASCVALFVPRAPFTAVLLAATTALFAPALYLVPYGTVIDSLYVLFGAAFILAMVRLEHSVGGRRRLMLWMGATIAYFLAITSKEIAVVAPFLLVPALVIAGPELSRTRVTSALRAAAPFMAISVAFVVVYELGHPASFGVYQNSPSFHKLRGTISLVTWTFGFRSPVHDYAFWIPPWGTGEKLVASLSLITLLVTLILAWSRLRTWRVALFVLSFLGLAVAIALPGGLPHHTYPLVMFAAVGLLAAATAACAALRQRSRLLATTYLSALGALALIQVAQAQRTYSGVVSAGPQSSYLKASTEIFYGSLLAPVRNAANPVFVFEDCLGGLHNPLRYYAKAADGEETVVPKFVLTEFSDRFASAAREHRASFVALCTGTNDPWYTLERYDARRKRLIQVAP